MKSYYSFNPGNMGENYNTNSTSNGLVHSTSDGLIPVAFVDHARMEGWPLFDMRNFASESSNMSVPKVKSVIFSNPATIVFWMDGTKTVVKCMQGYEYDEYTGFMAAVCKKLFGSSSAVRKIVRNHMPKEEDNHAES